MASLDFTKRLVEDSNISRVLILNILEDNGNSMDAKELLEEFDRRVELIRKELAIDSGNAVLSHCPICSGDLGTTKTAARRVHDIIFHYGYYKAQTGN